MISGIDTKQFKKWLLKEVGVKCKDNNWDCLICRSWILYEELKSYERMIKILDNFDFDYKKIRPHKAK